jgi:hypothetical protein
MPTSVRWLPHGLGYILNLTFTTVRCNPVSTLNILKPCGCMALSSCAHAINPRSDLMNNDLMAAACLSSAELS